MKSIVFRGYPNTQRTNIVTFSALYNIMVEEIKGRLKGKNIISLCLGRISDIGLSIEEAVNFFNVVFINENTLQADYYGDFHDANDQKLPQKKIIRLDNAFGEIPILPGYEQTKKFFDIGEGLELYKTFIGEIRSALSKEIGNFVQLCYKNDDETFSVIDGIIKEVNKGNILMEDFREVLVKDNKSLRVDVFVKREKNHRFISEKGYLFSVSNSLLNSSNLHDDGEVFGEEKCWPFLIETAA